MKIGNEIGMLMRVFLIVLFLILVFVFIYLMTNKRTFLRKLGPNSLPDYALHFYFARLLNEFS